MGWAATAVFVSSYFCKGQTGMRAIQAVAAIMWIVYGALLGSGPVVGANLIVAAVAGYSAWRRRDRELAAAEVTLQDDTQPSEAT